jgi:hypothetical protein
MLNIYNRDLQQYGIEHYSSSEFTSIQWRNIDVHREIATLDVNNDGHQEKIIREYRLKYDIQVHDYSVLYEGEIYPLGQLHDLTWYKLKDYPIRKKSEGKMQGSMDYRMMNVDSVEPFVFNGTTYISFRQLPKIDPDSRQKLREAYYHIIAKYKSGVSITREIKEPTELLQDICYYEAIQ